MRMVDQNSRLLGVSHGGILAWPWISVVWIFLALSFMGIGDFLSCGFWAFRGGLGIIGFGVPVWSFAFLLGL